MFNIKFTLLHCIDLRCIAQCFIRFQVTSAFNIRRGLKIKLNLLNHRHALSLLLSFDLTARLL